MCNENKIQCGICSKGSQSYVAGHGVNIILYLAQRFSHFLVDYEVLGLANLNAPVDFHQRESNVLVISHLLYGILDVDEALVFLGSFAERLRTYITDHLVLLRVLCVPRKFEHMSSLVGWCRLPGELEFLAGTAK